MKKIKNCCGVKPIVWKCNCGEKKFCGCDVEKIECPNCGRIIYGCDDEDIEQWNKGYNDEC